MRGGRWKKGLVIAACGLLVLMESPGPFAAPAELETIIANNRQALTHGRAPPAIGSLEFRLRMLDHGTLDADYKVTRDGRMRIDILQDGKRVYTEAYDGHQGWDWGAQGSAPVQDPHSATLWHGTQFPGGIFMLKDMAGLGHKLEYAGRERLDGVDYYVLKLTLSDGFVTYRYVNPDTWLIDLGRDFRAFHPALDAHQTWVKSAGRTIARYRACCSRSPR